MSDPWLRQFHDLADVRHGEDGPVGNLPVRWSSGDASPTSLHWVPLVHVSENAYGYQLEAELPEVRPADVKITMAEGALTIIANRKFKLNHHKARHAELAEGSFVHTFLLPDDARSSEPTTEFQEGVLTLHLARLARPRPDGQRQAPAIAPPPGACDCSSGWGINE